MPMNTDGKHGNLIMQDLILPASRSDPAMVAAYERFGKRLHWVDSSNMPGSFQMNTSWLYKPNRESILSKPDSLVGKPHTHSYPEILGFYGSDPDDPYNLGGEVELYLDGEQHIITKSCMVYIPPDLPHCPLLINRVDRPIFHYSVVMNNEYTSSRDNE